MDTLIRHAAAAASGGLVGTGLPVTALAALTLVPLAANAPRREIATLCVLHTGLAATPVFLAAHDYSGAILWSVGVYVVPVVLQGTILAAALAVRGRWRPPLVALAFVLLAVPPLATLVPLSPLPLAGLLFPGLGDAGLALLVALIALSSAAPRRAALALLATTLVAGAAHARLPDAAATDGTSVGLDTARGVPSPVRDEMLRPLRRHEERARAAASGRTRALLPESAFDVWRASDGAAFSGLAVTVLGGARHPVAPDAYVNVLLDGRTGEIRYAQRAPVPVHRVGDHRALSGADADVRVVRPLPALICVELVNPWIAATTARRAAGDGELLWVANLGWSRHDALERQLRALHRYWARLYAIEPVAAVNRRG